MIKQFSIMDSLEMIENEIKALENKDSLSLDDRGRLGQLKQCSESLGDCLFERHMFDPVDGYYHQ